MSNGIRELIFGSDYGSTDISSGYPDQFQRLRLLQNIRREKVLALVLCTFVGIIIGFINWKANMAEIDLYISRTSLYIHCVLLLCSSLFLFITWADRKKSFLKERALLFLHWGLLAVTLSMCACIAVNNELMNQRPVAFIVAIFSIASMLVLSVWERYVIFIGSYLIYIIGIAIYFESTTRAFQSVIFTVPLLILALLISRINYRAFHDNFSSHQQIKDKNKQLDNMFKTLEELLEQRTQQLRQTVEQENMRIEYLSNLSHELRTPLNLIFSTGQMMELACKDEDLQKRRQELARYNGIVQQNCYRMIRLVENLIGIVEIDAGEFKISLKKHDMIKMIKGILQSAEPYIKVREISLEFETDNQQLIVLCDKERIERVILNLLSNALKFTPRSGSIKIRLYKERDQVVISVKDTGIGVPPDKVEAIFDRFVQVDKSISRKREGSGIGLSIAKEIVHLHNGEIKLISEQGRGSEFIVTLPADLSACAVDHEEWDYLAHRWAERARIEFSDIYN